MVRFANLGLFSVTKASIPEVSNIVMDARCLSISWHIGSVISTRLSNIDCKSDKKSCLKRVNLEASGTLEKPQNSRNSLEYLRKRIKRESVGMEKMRCINRAQIKPSKGYLRRRPV